MPETDELFLARMNAEMKAAARDALGKVGDHIIERAQASLPKGDPAADPNPAVSLRNSFSARWEGDTLVLAVTSPYAIKQHESLHLKHPRGGTPKYLEAQFATVSAELEAELGIQVKIHLRHITNDPAEAKSAFSSIGVESLADYVSKFHGMSILPGSGVKVKKAPK